MSLLTNRNIYKIKQQKKLWKMRILEIRIRKPQK